MSIRLLAFFHFAWTLAKNPPSFIYLNNLHKRRGLEHEARGLEKRIMGTWLVPCPTRARPATNVTPSTTVGTEATLEFLYLGKIDGALRRHSMCHDTTEVRADRQAWVLVFRGVGVIQHRVGKPTNEPDSLLVVSDGGHLLPIGRVEPTTRGTEVTPSELGHLGLDR